MLLSSLSVSLSHSHSHSLSESLSLSLLVTASPLVGLHQVDIVKSASCSFTVVCIELHRDVRGFVLKDRLFVDTTSLNSVCSLVLKLMY